MVSSILWIPVAELFTYLTDEDPAHPGTEQRMTLQRERRGDLVLSTGEKELRIPCRVRGMHFDEDGLYMYVGLHFLLDSRIQKRNWTRSFPRFGRRVLFLTGLKSLPLDLFAETQRLEIDYKRARGYFAGLKGNGMETAPYNSSSKIPLSFPF